MPLSAKIVAYCLHEEGIVLEAYKDSVGVWTAFGGVTNASGHQVYPRYKDNPQTLEKALGVTIWLMQNKYLPTVEREFARRPLNEAQTAAALSFHWNTGAIVKATWVDEWLAHQDQASEADITDWSSHGTLTERRKREQALFFHGRWPADMRCPILPVNKPSYQPSFRRGVATDLMPTLLRIMPE